jgi:hypothetical protein
VKEELTVRVIGVMSDKERGQTAFPLLPGLD